MGTRRNSLSRAPLKAIRSVSRAKRADRQLRAELRRTAPGVGTSLICPFFVGTGMFAGVRTRFPFLLPILEPERVAAAVIRAVERNRAVVVLPWFVHSLKLLRLLPVRWLDPIASFFGIHVAMDTFSGRPKSA